MTNKSYFWIAVAVVVAGLIAYFAFIGNLNLFSFDKTSGNKPAVAVMPGASLVTPDGQVVNSNGIPVDVAVKPGSPGAPQQSDPISKSSLPKDAVKLAVTGAGFSPNNFTVKAGKVITLGVTSGDSQTHVFKFENSSLLAVAIGVGPGETRAITFNAPKKSGEYRFYCDLPGHAGRGETGVMIVK